MDTWTLLSTIVATGAVTLLCRAGFLLFRGELPFPNSQSRCLRYAAVAGLAAVIAPDLLMAQGMSLATWQNARLAGAVAGLGYFFWRGGLLGTIVAGTLTMLVLQLAAGWD